MANEFFWTGLLPSADTVFEGIIGGIEVLSIPEEEFVCFLSMQVPEYLQPINLPQRIEIVFTYLILILCHGFYSTEDLKLYNC